MDVDIAKDGNLKISTQEHTKMTAINISRIFKSSQHSITFHVHYE